ncbi:uncharacterized protein [Typha latifolia]|uniref:uncharacterized protein isoform X1 n=1 Tax=Typha latifolia TaxID=4733 RepID=UPI003C2CB6A6
MTPGVVREIGDEENLEREIEKQMGCMAGFLQLFDRNQILAGKRIYSTRAPPSSTVGGSTSPSERSEASVSQRFPSPAASPDAMARPLLPLPVFDFKDGTRTPWKFRESPRLSLDSRAVVDAKGKLRPREIRTTAVAATNSEEDEMERQRRSPSVVARLMGLDALPCAVGAELSKPVELRRSASESRVPRDPSYYRFVDPSSFQKFLPENHRSPDPVRVFQKSDPAPRTSYPSLQRKSCFDAEDFFPDPKRTDSITLYGEIERRLRMRGIDEPAKDLETLKQILEALQLKGLLHSRPPARQIDLRRNLVYDRDPYPNRRRSFGDSPIVVMKPAPKPPRRQISEPVARRSPIRSSNERNRSPRSPDPSSPVRRRSLINADSQKNPQPQRRISSVHSPKTSPKRIGQDPLAVRSPRNRRATPDRVRSPAEDDMSDSSISNSDFERSTTEDYKSGRSLLERCDKLLSSIAAMTAAEQVTAVDQQPSPVSVLDSSFLGDESSPSPATKRAIDFKDKLVDWEEDHWSQEARTIGSEDFYDGPESDDPDYLYVSEILRASDRCGAHSAAYAHLEKRQDRSPAPTWLHRRLLLDTVAEILDRARHVSPWDAFARARSLSSPAHPAGRPLARRVWAELRRIQEPVAADDLNDVTCGAIRKDMTADLGWSHPSAELSDAVLHIERQIFKDLVADAIRDLADVSSGPRLLSRRKLVF